MYVAKVNLWCHNSAILSLYNFLHVIELMRPCFNDIPQRWCLAEVITELPH